MRKYLISICLVGTLMLTACSGSDTEATAAADSAGPASVGADVFTVNGLDQLRRVGGPVSAFLTDAGTECDGAQLGFEEGAISSADLDGDGRPDYLVDLSRMTCGSEPAGNGWCGSGGCSFDTFVSNRGAVHQDSFLGMEPTIVRHGDGLGVSAMGRSGPWVAVWDGDSMENADRAAGAGTAAQSSGGGGDEAAVRRVVASIYDNYVNDTGTGEAFPENVETAELRRAVEAASDPEMGGLGFDYYCACQDYGDVSYDITGVAINGDRATVALDFRSFRRMVQMELRMRKVGGAWQVDDVIDPEGSLRESLAAY